MPRKKNSTNEVRDLKKQITQLQKELATFAAQRLADIEAAAEAGYELGVIESQEKELQRAQAIADAAFEFEKAYSSKSSAKTAPVAKAATKRRGRPAQAKKRVKRAKKVPAAAVPTSTASELPSAPVPETAEPESESESETMH